MTDRNVYKKYFKDRNVPTHTKLNHIREIFFKSHIKLNISYQNFLIKFCDEL